jgi:hypothetical protein
MAKFFIPKKEEVAPPAPFDRAAVLSEISNWMSDQTVWTFVRLVDTDASFLLVRSVSVTIDNWANKAPLGAQHVDEEFQEVIMVHLAGREDAIDKEALARSAVWTKKLIITDNVEGITKHLTTLEGKRP